MPKLTYAENPVHPVLNDYPAALVPTSVAFDMLHLVTRRRSFKVASFFTLVFALITGGGCRRDRLPGLSRDPRGNGRKAAGERPRDDERRRPRCGGAAAAAPLDRPGRAVRAVAQHRGRRGPRDLELVRHAPRLPPRAPRPGRGSARLGPRGGSGHRQAVRRSTRDARRQGPGHGLLGLRRAGRDHGRPGRGRGRRGREPGGDPGRGRRQPGGESRRRHRRPDA